MVFGGPGLGAEEDVADAFAGDGGTERGFIAFEERFYVCFG